MDLNYNSLSDLLSAADQNDGRLSTLVLSQQAEQMELSEAEIYEKMQENYQVMASSMAATPTGRKLFEKVFGEK